MRGVAFAFSNVILTNEVSAVSMVAPGVFAGALRALLASASVTPSAANWAI